jgi:hypothetical protein
VVIFSHFLCPGWINTCKKIKWTLKLINRFCAFWVHACVRWSLAHKNAKYLLWRARMYAAVGGDLGRDYETGSWLNLIHRIDLGPFTHTPLSPTPCVRRSVQSELGESSDSRHPGHQRGHPRTRQPAVRDGVEMERGCRGREPWNRAVNTYII